MDRERECQNSVRERQLCTGDVGFMMISEIKQKEGCPKSLDSSKNDSQIGQKNHVFSYFQITNFPPAVMTDLIRSGMDNIRFMRVSGLILDQAAWMAFLVKPNHGRVFLSHLRSSSRIEQRFSIGFRSGELAGQTPFSMTVMLRLRSQAEML